MTTDTPFTAALATAYADRGIPTMAQIAALCGHKPPTVTDTAHSPSEARTMDSTRNVLSPSDAERTLYLSGRRGEAMRLYAERTGAGLVRAGRAIEADREHSYARAEAAAAVVKAARAFVGAQDLYSNTYAPLEKAVAAYEQLIGDSE